MRTFLSLSFIAAATTAAGADWFTGDPYAMHFPQTPDTGGAPQLVDITQASAMTSGWVADDWMATTTGAVTGIHIWGDWYDNHYMPGQANDGEFTLAIYADGGAAPGALLWSAHVAPGGFQIRQETNWSLSPHWYHWPSGGNPFLQRDSLHQFNFTIPAASAFVQTAAQKYWLGVTYALDFDSDGLLGGMADTFAPLGWNSTDQHYGANAVHAPGGPWQLGGTTAPLTGWGTVADPNGAPQTDMAFVITPAPGAVAVFLGAGPLCARRRRSP